MSTIRRTTKVGGVLADVTSMVLCDPTAAYGVKRNDTGVAVVSANAAMTKVSTGTYSYVVPTVAGVSYTAWIKRVYLRHVGYREVVFTADADIGDSLATPSDIFAALVIGEGWLSRPSLGEAWPLYVSRLPDSDDVEDNAVAVFNTPGVLHGKDMQANVMQHHGLQIRFRSTTESLGAAKAQELLDRLSPVSNEDVAVDVDEEYRIHNVVQASSIVVIHEDEKQRVHQTVNLLIAYTRTV